MKTRSFIAVMATSMILAAPALAAGAGVAADPAPAHEQSGSDAAGPVQYGSQPEHILGIACYPGPIMEMEDSSIGDGSGFRKGERAYRQVIDPQAGIIISL